MRKRATVAFIVLSLCLSASVASAQAGGGLKAGIAFSKLPGEEGFEQLQWLAGWSVGGFAAIPISKQVFFQPEVLYTRKGVKFETAGASFKIKLDYVEIPLLVRFSPGAAGGIGVDIFGGIAPAIRTSAKTSFVDVTEANSENEDISEDTKGWDAGLVAGAGIRLGHVNVEFRLTEGLVKVDNDPSGAHFRNRTMSVLAGFRF